MMMNNSRFGTAFRRVAVVLSVALISSFCNCSTPGFVLNSLSSFDLFASSGARNFVITSNVDLRGMTVKIPEGTLFTFKDGGSLNNGTLDGSFSVDGVGKNSLNVTAKKGCRILGIVPVYNHSSEVNRSIISAAVEGVRLMEDISIDSAVVLRAALDGNQHKLVASQKASSALRIENSKIPILISNIEIVKEYEPGSINRNYALNIRNSSNVAVTNSTIEGRIRVVNATLSDKAEDISENYLFSGCRLTCDLSVCPQGATYGQDHLAFYSIKNVAIEDCEIVSRSVNRVLKTSEYFPEKKYEKASRCTENVVFRRNRVDAVSAHGKQMWDMYCGTLDVLIEDNDFQIEGFTRFVEDKAYQDKYRNGVLAESTIRIVGNRVSTCGGDLFQFLANRQCDCFEVRENLFVLSGPNVNTNTGFQRAAGFYLQGYKSAVIVDNSFVFKDEAIGLVVGKVNFQCDSTLMANNEIQDAYRVYFAQAKHPLRGSERVRCGYFGYKDNKKKYTSAYKEDRGELLVASTDVDVLDVSIADNESLGHYMIAFAKESQVGDFRYVSKNASSNAFYTLSKGVTIKKIQDEKRFVRKDNFWTVKK